MYQGTTPTIPITIEGVDLTEARVIITIKDEKKRVLHNYESARDFIVYKSGDDSVTNLTLTQEDTLNYGDGLCSVQARWVFPDGIAGATQEAHIQMQAVLNKELISYGD